MIAKDLARKGSSARDGFRTPTTVHTALVDGHVHIHGLFDVASLLEHASENRDSAARQQSLSPAIPGVLMLTESQGADGFGRVAQRAGMRIGRWQVQPTGEPMSLRLETENAAPLILIAGRQIVTAERLEVLALGTLATFADGLSLDTVLNQVDDAGAMPVLPWGFGKWVGGRGRIVRGLLNSPRAARLFVGDNGGRLGMAAEPSLFKLARQRGIPILPGTDPFPFAEQVRRPLSFGFVLAADAMSTAPAAAIREALQARQQPEVFGRLASLAGFVGNQLAMQWHKRRNTGRPAR